MAASASAERYLFPIVSISFISVLLFLSEISGLTASSYFFFSRLPPPSSVRYGPAHLSSFAYLITGSRGDGPQILRLLLAIYHPRNRYLLHLSHEATDKGEELAGDVGAAGAAGRQGVWKCGCRGEARWHDQDGDFGAGRDPEGRCGNAYAGFRMGLVRDTERC